MNSDAGDRAAPGSRDPGVRIPEGDRWEYTAAPAASGPLPAAVTQGAGSFQAAQHTAPAGTGLPAAPAGPGTEPAGALDGLAGGGDDEPSRQDTAPPAADASPASAWFAAAVWAVLVAFAVVMLLSTGPAVAARGSQARPAVSVPAARR